MVRLDHHDHLRLLSSRAGGRLTRALAYNPFSWSGTLGTATGTSMTGYQIQPGDSWWAHVTSLCDVAAARVYCDDNRAWHIDSEPGTDTVVTPDLTIATGDQAPAVGVMRGLIDGSKRQNRTDWANVVTGRWEWTNAAGTRSVIGGRAPTGTPPATTLCVTHKTFSTPTTQAEANTACATILARAKRRGETRRITTRSAYWLRPRATVAVRGTGDTAPVNQIVSALTWRLDGSGLMDLELRTPIT